MYTPARRRGSVSEPSHKFTPSKRGQAALDALALGYDVQLPECSFALIPRTSVSEQALGSLTSTGIQQNDQLPRSTSLGDSHRRTGPGPKQHRNPASEFADKKRFARQVQSPDSDGRRSSINEDWILDFSTQSSAATTVDSSSRASTCSYQPSTSQYVLDSPHRTRRPDDSTYRGNLGVSLPTSHTPRSMANIPDQSSPARHHSMTIHQTPSQLPNQFQSQNKSNTMVPTASATCNNEGLGRLPGTRLATRSHPTRPAPLQSMAPLPESSSVERSLDAYFSPRHDEYQINVHQLGGSAQYARIHSGISGTRSSQGQPHGARPQQLKSPAWSASGARHSPVDRVTRQLPDCEGSHGDFGPSRPHHHYSSSEPPVPFTSARRNSRPQAGSQRPQLAPSSMISPSPPYGVSSASGQHVSSRPSLRVSTQTIPGTSIQPLRSAPLPSTSTSSRPLFHDDDEAFKVHPERAAVSRMETLLMLSACRAQAQLPQSGGIIGHPAIDGVVIAPTAHDYPGYPALGPQMGPRSYQTLTHPNILGLSDTKAQGPQEAPRDVGSRGGTVISAQERSPANRRPRQRSGSMGSPFPDSPQRPRPYNGPSRNRQRSASVIVQGLSPDAVKKLRMYEQLKYQDKGRPESLREIIGCTAKYRVYGARANKNTTLNSLNAPISPTLVPLPPSPVILGNETSFRAPALPSPRNVPLPLSPPQSPTLCAMANRPAVSSFISSDSFMRYRASRGIESPRPIRTRQNTCSGHVIPTLRLISSPERVDPPSGTDTLPTDPAGGTQEALEIATTLADERASLKPKGLKLDPQLERILTPTPPPAFWSPPPHSAAVRTSAPLPLLPAATISSSPTTRAASISLPATRTASAPPLRPMSVPPSGDPLRVGDSDDVRRAWSCQPATAELPPVKSFAGDWRQSMVIELSDEEEEEEEETTDTDFSELEDEDVDNCQVLIASDVVAEGDMIAVPDPKSNSINDARIGAASRVKPAESRTSKGVVSSGVVSGVNAVEAVQHAIVKLALDNAEAVQSRRALQTRAKRPAAPVRAGSMTTAYPPANQPFPRHSLDSERLRDPNLLHTLPNQYLGATSRGYHTPNLPVYPHAPTHLALESLRSGLELRAAASVSAVEEAVRARSVSPSFPPQDGQAPGPRPNPGFVLPPRLQRLQGIHPRGTPPLPTPRLEIPTLASPRLNIPALQQRRLPYETSLPASPVVSLYPGTLTIPQPSVVHRQYPTTPLVQERNQAFSNASTPKVEQCPLAPRQSRVPEASASSNRSQLANIIVDSKPVPPAPATAPLARNHGEHRRQTRRSAEAVLSSTQDSRAAPVAAAPVPPAPPIIAPAPPAPALVTPEPAASPSTPAQPAASSPKSKQNETKKRWGKHRKNTASGQSKAVVAGPAPATPVVSPPKPKEHTPSPKKALVPHPKKASVPKPKNVPAPTPKDISSPTPKPKRKHKPPKNHKSAKPGAAPVPAPAVTS